MHANTRLSLDLFQVAVPVVPTIRVIVTFTKFEELQTQDEFAIPAVSSRESLSSSSSWFQWIKSSYQNLDSSSTGRSSSRAGNYEDPFAIPRDYSRVSAEEKRKRTQEKVKSKKLVGPSSSR